MARYRRRDQIEERVTGALDAAGSRWSVDLIAKRATGVPGYRVTLAFLETEGARSAFVELEPAPSREAASALAVRLREAPERVRSLLEEELGA